MSYDERVIDLDRLEELRQRGVKRATFHPDGSLASVDFEEAGSPSVIQHQTSTPAREKRYRGGRIVPDDGSDSVPNDSR